MKYSSSFVVTDSDLRCSEVITKNDQIYFFTGDNNGILYIFLFDQDKKEFSLYKTIQAHKRRISYIIYIPNWQGIETIITSSLDQNAYFWELNDILTKEKDDKLLDKNIEAYGLFQAKDNICKITFLNHQRIAFQSWDKKTSIIDERGEKIILDHGELASWGICEFDEFYITADANNSLTIWSKSGELIEIIKDAHKAAVRGIFVYKGKIFSFGNDGFLCQWSLIKDESTNKPSLKLEKNLMVTDAYLYCFTIIKNHCYIGSEDKVIYEIDLDKMELFDAIPTYTTPWSLSSLNDNILISCNAKGHAFLFSSLNELTASKEKEEIYFKNLSQIQINNSMLENMETSEFPTSLDTIKPKPGIFYTLYEDNKIKFYIYSFNYGKWICVGYLKKNEIPKKKDPEGNEWDTSITVMLEDDTIYELYLNYSTPPEETAKNFVEKHKLSPNFIPQIKEFIEVNLGSQLKSKEKSLPKSIDGKFIDGKIEYTIADMQGRRPTMEDYTIAFEDPETKSSFFCVFDGHGSTEPSKYAGNRFKEIALQLIKENKTKDEELLHKILMILHEEMLKFEFCGSCAVCIYIKGDIMRMANLGDSRCLLCRNVDGSQTVQQISIDHKATDPDALIYAEQHGGHIVNGRLNNILAVSRFLGDSSLSPFANPEPYCSECQIQKGDKIILGCDGIFDVLSNEYVCQISFTPDQNTNFCANQIRDTAYNNMSFDNITIALININS